MIRLAVIIAGALTASACVTYNGGDDAEPRSELAQCAAKGGTVERRGILNLEMCVLPYSDAGKVCTDGSQCEGFCLASSNTETGETGTADAEGMCQADDQLFGCVARIEDGIVQPTLCID